jgi:hypothetical protein
MTDQMTEIRICRPSSVVCRLLQNIEARWEYKPCVVEPRL